MSETLTSSDLLSKLKRRKEEELRQIESIERDALKRLSEDLKSFTENELNTIERVIKEQKAEIERSLNKTRSEAIKQSKALRQELIEEIEEIRAQAIGSGAKVWLWRLLTPIVLIGALALGTWGLSAYLSAQITGQIKQLEQLQAEAKQQRETMNRYVVRSYVDALEFDQKPRLWQTKQGTWVVQFKRGR